MAGKRALSLCLLVVFCSVFVTRTASVCGRQREPEWLHTPGLQIAGHVERLLDNVQISDCKTACLEARDFDCRSFEFFSTDTCSLSSVSKDSDGVTVLENQAGVDYYEYECPSPEKADAECGDEEDDWESSDNIQVRGHLSDEISGTVDECKEACKNSDGCRSLEYYVEHSACALSDKTLGDPGVISEQTDGVTYYELVCAGGPDESTEEDDGSGDDDDNEVFEFLEDNPEFAAMIGMGALVLILLMTAIIAICVLSPKYSTNTIGKI